MNEINISTKLVNHFSNIDIMMSDICVLSKYIDLDFDFLSEFKLTYETFTDTLERFIAKDLKKSDLVTLEMAACQIDIMAQDLLYRCKNKIKYLA